ncbi:Amidase [Thalassovita litoralis]|jgi:amidase|uniref:Amidase n=1 Tax=Thalassovita litoralis TaxID=1010611 RepID=A0A521FHB2_9RHOB|nr:amidase family protein [Thalassovita litoralis]SMO95384.1 Amidase [Thalassovita litoralis]
MQRSPPADQAGPLRLRLMFTESENDMRTALAEKGSPEMQAYYDAFLANFEPTDLRGLLAALQERVVIQRAWAEMFETIDVLLMPTSLARPFENDLDFKDTSALAEISRIQAPLYTVNALGLPSAALPTHLEDGIPVGVQLIGPMHEDGFVLDVAGALEQQLGTLWQKLHL